MKRIEYDVSKIGFEAAFKNWQLKTIQVVWDNPEGVKSRIVYERVNQALGNDSISRASVINFLEALRGMGVLNGNDATGKGGHHWIYFAAMDEAGFKKFIVETMVTKLAEDFPIETKKAIDGIA